MAIKKAAKKTPRLFDAASDFVVRLPDDWAGLGSRFT